MIHFRGSFALTVFFSVLSLSALAVETVQDPIIVLEFRGTAESVPGTIVLNQTLDGRQYDLAVLNRIEEADQRPSIDFSLPDSRIKGVATLDVDPVKDFISVKLSFRMAAGIYAVNTYDDVGQLSYLNNTYLIEVLENGGVNIARGRAHRNLAPYSIWINETFVNRSTLSSTPTAVPAASKKCAAVLRGIIK